MYEEINVHIKMILCIQLHMYRCANWENIFVSLIILDNILKASHPKSYFEMNYTVYHITHAVLYKNKDIVIFFIMLYHHAHTWSMNCMALANKHYIADKIA